MLFLLFLSLMYFLPTIIGRDKSDAGLIFLVNLFLGWTVVGWIVTFIWASAADRRPVPVRLVPVASSGRFCCQCGALSPGYAHFCGGCGRSV
jgi:threonine/homoserine/homoserine lactone efflux protein